MKRLVLTQTALLFLSYTYGQQQNSDLKLVVEWKNLEFKFPSPEHRQAAINEQKYISTNVIPIDVDVYYKDQGMSKVFVTIPRFMPGVPVTLGTISRTIAANGPEIDPYPDYSWHQSHGTNCDGLTSVFRVAIDDCNRMWVLDAGRIGADQLCSPQLVVFNLDNDKDILRYRFPDSVYRSGLSLLITPIVDVRDPFPGKCRNTMVYIADVTGFAIIVFDMQRMESWRVQNKLFFPYPNFGTHTIAGESFDLMDGVFSMSLSSKSAVQSPRTFVGFYGNNNYGGRPVVQGDRLLYFHALASGTENSVPLRLLDNQTMWQANPDSEPRAFVEIGTRSIQAAAEAIDQYGNMFFGIHDPRAIACWDSSRPYNLNNMRIVAQNDQNLQFASGMKVIKNRNGAEELWAITGRLQKFMTGTLNYNEPNFRIQARKTEELLGGNRCIGSGLTGTGLTFPIF